ncbi:hypothetical protein O181_020553 [Austropuccinia psidii MF-1]|uniref:Uncharacterized protein n=1 Tax=Austropuccinia psidii MF-1 TaxID=1389203 RepID=A0A9Q3CD53_9BASI|nr:hypothetical protein [Austropuccinia psidii MF-1]
MEGEAPSRRGGMKSRRSRSFTGLLGGYLGMSEGERARLGEAEDEQGEESVEEAESEEHEVATALAGAPEAFEAANLAHYNQPLVSQAEPNFLKMMEQGSIHGETHSSSCSQGQFQIPCIQDSINEGT